MTSPATRPTGEFISHSPEETQSLGAHFGLFLQGGEIVLLSGQLGAGKTLFVKGMAQALGVPEDEVTSPSFTLVNHYTGRLKLYHIDLYRLNEGAGAAYAVDLDELLMDERAVIVIEWAERMGAYPLPEPVWRIQIAGDGDAPRTLSINSQSTAA
ncbi:MAG TPA: tRNA (adenosine(37)-N6)-threonylcarbamoyltransferase complex ATPase subunit type 1 TsaE [Pyrinomonadaceae bacterium]|jgi:tRNA threonylcarbamoyladenosine biosynthesis protein TsaE